MEEEKAIAMETLRQLGGMAKLKAMLGAHNFQFGKEENGDVYASFRIKTSRKINYIKITLNWKDFYDVEFGLVKGTSYNVVETKNDIDCENLRECCEQTTECAFSL